MRFSFLSRAAATLATLALLATYGAPLAVAAGVTITVSSADRQTFTLDLPAGVDLETSDAVTLKITTTSNGTAVNLSGNQATSGYLAGDANTADTLTNAGDANGRIVITEDGSEDPAAGADVTFTLTSALSTDTAYTISYIDTDGNYGAAMINFGTANQVTVTATVEPTLTLSLANTSIALGTLSVGSVTSSSTDTDVTAATNALNGLTIYAADDNPAGLRSTAASKTVAAAATTVAGTEGFDISVTENTDPQTNGALANNFDDDDGDDVALTTSAQAIASTSGPTSGYVARVDYRAAISNITPAASDYTTTLTYTVTGSY